jgi:hypothetical protein
VEGLEAALATAERAAPPSLRDFLSLERRLGRMAQEMAAGEARWRDALGEALGGRRAAGVDAGAGLRDAEARHAAELAARDAVIARLRLEVDELLDAARALQLRASSAGASRA